MSDRITDFMLEESLRLLAKKMRMWTVSEFEKSAVWSNIPDNALLINAYSPVSWLGRIETRDGRTPFGERRYSKRSLYDLMDFAMHAIDLLENTGVRR